MSDTADLGAELRALRASNQALAAAAADAEIRHRTEAASYQSSIKLMEARVADAEKVATDASAGFEKQRQRAADATGKLLRLEEQFAELLAQKDAAVERADRAEHHRVACEDANAKLVDRRREDQEQHARQMAEAKAVHDRDVNHLRARHAIDIDGLRATFQVDVDHLKRQNESLRADVERLRGEIIPPPVVE